ncbi:hypothetical protein ABK040_006414 [Willaertia magna]
MSTTLQRSMKAIEGLKPAAVWKYFLNLSQIPRPSKKEEKVVQYLREYAKENNFEIVVDQLGNSVIKVPATKGYENAPIVAIQGHVDMVCEKNKETVHDFDNDPICLVRSEDGKWISADNTTLGADNGIGCCCGLAVATDPEVIHGPLELLFTVDEEQGMSGVMALTPDFLKAKYLLNLDTEEADCFYVACAGGIDTVGHFDAEVEDLNKSDYTPVSIMVSGLNGGHSGIEIHTGKANAIKLVGRLLLKLLSDLPENDLKAYYFEGGNKRNAIPRECSVNVFVKNDKLDLVKKIASEFETLAKNEFNATDAGVKVTVTQDTNVAENQKVFTQSFLHKIVNTILAVPHGAVQMSPEIEGLTETSTNLAIIEVKDGKLDIVTSQRSSIESAKHYIASSVASVLRLAGARVVQGEGYPGWKPNMNSELLAICKNVFKNIYQKDAGIKAIHAGLECGLLGGIFPNMDMISFGPTILGAHSPVEKVCIEDVTQTYELTKAILTELAKRQQ